MRCRCLKVWVVSRKGWEYSLAIDYTFVSIVLTFSFGFTFMLLAFFTELPRNAIFHFFAFLTFILGSQLYLMTAATFGNAVALHLLFYFFGIIEFFMTIITGITMLSHIYKMRKQAEYGLEDWEEDEFA